jgi:hypothetical protein
MHVMVIIAAHVDKQVSYDELTVHGEYDVKTYMDVARPQKRETWSPPAHRKITPGPVRQVDMWSHVCGMDYDSKALYLLATGTLSVTNKPWKQLMQIMTANSIKNMSTLLPWLSSTRNRSFAALFDL